MLGKLDATASINTSGVGLGLSTCKKIAEALHGKIFIIDNEEEIQRQVEFYTDWIEITSREEKSHDKSLSNSTTNYNKKG